MKSTDDKQSRYVGGGSTEVNPTALEWWSRKTYASSPSDRTYVVESRFEGRLDLIAQTFLGSTRLWWLLAMYNNILDPYNEVRQGLVLYIPEASRIDELTAGKLGGFSSEREQVNIILPIV